MLVDVIPTKERINSYVPLVDLSCFLCGGWSDSIQNLVFYCPTTAICWWNSPWNICIQTFASLSISNWIVDVLNKSSSVQIPLDEMEQSKFIHFFIVLIDQILLVCNKIRLHRSLPNWNTFSQRLNRSYIRYWKAIEDKKTARQVHAVMELWIPLDLANTAFPWMLHSKISMLQLELCWGIILVVLLVLGRTTFYLLVPCVRRWKW